MKKDGLKLLLLFAYGALKKGVCGDVKFSRKVKRYLEGEKNLRREIIEQMPQELKTAWPNLVRTSKLLRIKPLDLEVVGKYIFETHNLDVPDDCRVKNGIILSVEQGKALVKLIDTSEEKNVKINFLKNFSGKLRPGDKVFFHHGWLAAKEEKDTEFKALFRHLSAHINF